MKRIIALCAILAGLLSGVILAAENSTMVGWATFYNNGNGVSGGGTFSLQAPNAVVVRNETEFYSAIGKNDITPKIIIIDGTINRVKTSDFMLQGIKNKTIFGMPGAKIITATSDTYGFLFRDCENIIVRNIAFEGKGSTTNQKGDLICTENSVGVWIDHCSFTDGGDGNVDFTKGSDLISVTYCKFYYTSLSGHTYACLIGSSDSDGDTDNGKLRCTFQYVWWADGCVERMPRVRFGKVHIVNNLFDSKDALYCIRAGYSANLYIEKNSFINVKQPVAGQFEDYDPASPYWCTFASDNITVGTELGDSQAKIENDLYGVWSGPGWIPSSQSNYDMKNSVVSADLSEKIVRTDAGPFLKINAEGNIVEAEKLYVVVNNSFQSIIQGKPITDIIFKTNQDSAVLTVDGALPEGLSQSISTNQIIISGTINTTGTFDIRVKGSYLIDGQLLESEAVATVIVTDPNTLSMTDVAIAGVPVSIQDNQGTVQFSKNADISNLIVTFKVPETIQSDFISGTAYDFSQGSLQITLKAPDNSTAVFSLSVTKNQQFKILYLIQTSKYSITETDKLFNMLGGKYQIERRDADAAARDFTYYKDFDLVVMQESLEGKNCNGISELYKLHTEIDLPLLSTKSFFYSSGRLGWGTPLQGASNKDISIPETYLDHPLFNGITIQNGILSGISSQPVTLNESFAGKSLGTAENASGGRGTSIHELSANQRYGANIGKKSGYILISLMHAEFPNINENVLKLFDNAVDYLLSVTLPDDVSELKSGYLKFDGQKILNPDRKLLRMFDLSGILLHETQSEIEMGNFCRGVFLVKSPDGEVLKIMK